MRATDGSALIQPYPKEILELEPEVVLSSQTNPCSTYSAVLPGLISERGIIRITESLDAGSHQVLE